MGENKSSFGRIETERAGFVVVLIVIALGTLHVPALQAQDSAQEYAVKAAFLYNFARFTQWPSDSFPERDSPIVVCILGNDPFGGTIEFLREKTIHGRPVELRREDDLVNVKSCHVLFVSSSKKDHLDQVLSETQGWNVLTVSDMERFAHRGGGVGFVRQDNKIRFEVNSETTRTAGLRLSSKLLRLALVVAETSRHVGGGSGR